MNGRSLFILFILTFSSHNGFAVPEPKKNILLETGSSFLEIMNESTETSLLARCKQESRSTRFFSNSCTELLTQLQKKMNMLVVQSDLRIQHERLSAQSKTQKGSEHLVWLAKLNLLSLQAEEALRAAVSNKNTRDAKDALADVLPSVQKVQTSFLAYLKFNTK